MKLADTSGNQTELSNLSKDLKRKKIKTSEDIAVEGLSIMMFSHQENLYSAIIRVINFIFSIIDCHKSSWPAACFLCNCFKPNCLIFIQTFEYVLICILICGNNGFVLKQVNSIENFSWQLMTKVLHNEIHSSTHKMRMKTWHAKLKKRQKSIKSNWTQLDFSLVLKIYCTFNNNEM